MRRIISRIFSNSHGYTKPTTLQGFSTVTKRGNGDPKKIDKSKVGDRKEAPVTFSPVQAGNKTPRMVFKPAASHGPNDALNEDQTLTPEQQTALILAKDLQDLTLELMKTPTLTKKEEWKLKTSKTLKSIIVHSVGFPFELVKILAKVCRLYEIEPGPLLSEWKLAMEELEQVLDKRLGSVVDVTRNLSDITVMYVILNDLNRLMHIRKRGIKYSLPLKQTAYAMNKIMRKLLDSPHYKQLSLNVFCYKLAKMIYANWNMQVDDTAFYERLFEELSRPTHDVKFINDMALGSLLFISTKLQLSASTNLEEFQKRLIAEVVRRITRQSFQWKKLPYLFYTMARGPKGLILKVAERNKEFSKNLVNMTSQKVSAYTVTELATIMNSLSQAPFLDENYALTEQIIKVLMQDTNIKNVVSISLYTVALGLRRPLNEMERLPKEQKELLENFVAKLKEVFKEQFPLLLDSLKLRMMYEWTHSTKVLTRDEVLANYLNYYLSYNLKNLNIYDLLTIGFVVKKYAQLRPEHLDFWRRFFDVLPEKHISKNVEYQRLDIIFQNLMSFLRASNIPEGVSPDLISEWSVLLSEAYLNFQKTYSHLAPMTIIQDPQADDQIPTEQYSQVEDQIWGVEDDKK